MRPAALIDDLAQLVTDYAAQHEQQAAALLPWCTTPLRAESLP